MIVAERIVGKDHGDLLAQASDHERRHRLDLALDVGDAGLERVAVEHAARHMVALGHHEIGNLQLACPRCRTHDDMAEERAEGDIAVFLGGEFLDDLGPTLGIGAVIGRHDLHRPSVDATGIVDSLGRSLRRSVIPSSVGGTYAGPVNLEAEPDRLGGVRLRKSETRQRAGCGNRPDARSQCLQRSPAGQRRCRIWCFLHGTSPLEFGCRAPRQPSANRATKPIACPVISNGRQRAKRRAAMPGARG